MSKLKLLRRLLSDRSMLGICAVAGLMLFAIAAPASAQLFPFFGGGQQQPQRHPQRGGGGGGGGFFSNPFFSPLEQRPPQQQQQPAQRQDFSRAPAPDKREVPAERNVLVLGDAMADWLGYGLEDALSETPDLGVIRKYKTVSGLIRYQPKGEPSDWAAAAREILATEKPEVIVVMLGLHDRMAIRETAAADRKADARSDGQPENKPTDAKPGDMDDGDPDLQIAAPEKGARGSHGVHQFRDERWGELYAKKIDEMIAVLKSKGVPVLWVGLPSIRGTKSTSDALYLNTLYREAATRAGITYVDLWDGFVDESGRYLAQGPDFEGQIRRLRSNDGVYFTKAGARKLAHYVEREISRLLAGRPTTIEIPTEPGAPEVEAKPGLPAPRPIAGPVIPLVASSVGTDELLGAANVRPVSVDPLAAKALVKGDALTPPPGRADDAAWPRRDVERERAGEPVVATVTSNNGASPGGMRPGDKPKRQHIIVRTNDPRFGDASPQQRRNAPPPRPLPPPPGPADWLSRLFQ